MESVLSEVVALEDLQRFEKKFNAELKAGSVSKGTKFEYAWCLVRSKYSNDIKKGIALLEDLLPKGNKEEQRDYVFYLSVANYRLKESVPYLKTAKAKVHPAQITLPDSGLAGATGNLEYEKALKYIQGLLKTEPSNTQALELEKLIKKALQKDGLVGMAIVGGMALGAAGLAGLIGLAIAKSKS